MPPVAFLLLGPRLVGCPAVLFWSLRTEGTLDKGSMHGSCRVIKGRKQAATKWFHVAHYAMGGEQAVSVKHTTFVPPPPPTPPGARAAAPAAAATSLLLLLLVWLVSSAVVCCNFLLPQWAAHFEAMQTAGALAPGPLLPPAAPIAPPCRLQRREERLPGLGRGRRVRKQCPLYGWHDWQPRELPAQLRAVRLDAAGSAAGEPASWGCAVAFSCDL
jgi:hypothetical protein